MKIISRFVVYQQHSLFHFVQVFNGSDPATSFPERFIVRLRNKKNAMAASQVRELTFNFLAVPSRLVSVVVFPDLPTSRYCKWNVYTNAIQVFFLMTSGRYGSLYKYYEILLDSGFSRKINTSLPSWKILGNQGRVYVKN